MSQAIHGPDAGAPDRVGMSATRVTLTPAAAQLLLRLMREDTFPKIWVPSPENRDLRQLLWHRHRLVQMRVRDGI